jgi:hypothetical protein
MYSFKYIRRWDDFQWHRYIQSSMSHPVKWITKTVTAGMTYQEISLRIDTLVDTDLHQNSN